MRPSTPHAFLGALFISFLLAAPTASYATGPLETLDLEQILRITMSDNARIRAADLEVDVRESQEASVRARMLPMLRVESNAFLWDDDVVFDRFSKELGPLFQPLLPAGAVPPSLDLTVRDEFVFTAQAALVEPLGKLYQIYQGQAAKAAMTDAARKDAVAERRKLQEQVVDTYYKHISADNMRRTLESALKQVAAFEEMTQQYLTAGLVEKDALLKVQVQHRELEKGLIQVDKGVALSRSMLNMLMSRPLDAPLTISCLVDASCGKSAADTSILSTSLAEMQSEAVTARPELQSGRKQSLAADHGRKAKLAAMFPDINAIVGYQRNHGTGEFMPKNAVFGGVAIEWNVFEWGATKYEWDAAEAQYAKAQASIQAAEDGIRLQVHQRRLEAKEAVAQAVVAEAAVTLAAENLRLEQARYEVQNTAATDLIQAQTSLVKAKNEHTVASMKVRDAVRKLRIAMGRDLLASNATDRGDQ